jgi:hypothetical protein
VPEEVTVPFSKFLFKINGLGGVTKNVTPLQPIDYIGEFKAQNVTM